MSNEYLMKEYELCFQQLRYYDDRNTNLLKYLFSLTSAIATAQFAVYKFLQGPSLDFFVCQAFLSSIVFISTLLLYLALLQNRLYFVYIARQLNAIRGYLMENEAPQFRNNQLYTSTDFPALKPGSVHTFQLLGAAFLSSLFAGISAYSFYPSVGKLPCVATASLTFFLVLITEIIGGMVYLSSASKKSADHAIHGQGAASS